MDEIIKMLEKIDERLDTLQFVNEYLLANVAEIQKHLGVESVWPDRAIVAKNTDKERDRRSSWQQEGTDKEPEGS